MLECVRNANDRAFMDWLLAQDYIEPDYSDCSAHELLGPEWRDDPYLSCLTFHEATHGGD
jgi:hypothetical protein